MRIRLLLLVISFAKTILAQESEEVNISVRRVAVFVNSVDTSMPENVFGSFGQMPKYLFTVTIQGDPAKHASKVKLTWMHGDKVIGENVFSKHQQDGHDSASMLMAEDGTDAGRSDTTTLFVNRIFPIRSDIKLDEVHVQLLNQTGDIITQKMFHITNE